MKTYSQISQYGVKKSKSKGVKKKHISRTKLCWVLYRTTIITTTKNVRMYICRKTTIDSITFTKKDVKST